MIVSPGPFGFWSYLREHRMVHVAGPYRSGKTLFAVVVGEWLKAYGYRVWANFPCLCADPFEPVLPVKTVILLDECAHYVDARDWRQTELGAFDYLGKLDSYVIFSGVGAIDVRLRTFLVERRLYPLFGDVLWLYRGETVIGERCYMGLVSPGAYYRRYSTRAREAPELYFFLGALMRELSYDVGRVRAEVEKRIEGYRDSLREAVDGFFGEAARIG